MVNFRYHLVSLIAVFLALALGVVLGAGPLQNAIEMRDEEGGVVTAKDLSVELEAANALGEQSDVFVWAVAEEVLPEALGGISVAVVSLPGTTSSDTSTIVRGLELAGAAVDAEVEVTSRWASTTDATYRQTLAAAISSHLSDRPDDTGPAGILAAGLVTVMTSEGAEVDLIRDMLTDESTEMVVAGSLPSSPVEAIVLVGPSQGTTSASTSPQSGSDSEVSQDEEELFAESWIALAAAATSAPSGAAAVGQAQEPGQFIFELRDADVRITTVDQGGTAMSAVNTALALGSETVAAYGQQAGATAPLAPLTR